MKKTFLAAALLWASSTVFGQKSAILTVFKKYDIDLAILDSNVKNNANQYSFTEQTTLATESSKKISIAKYDPRLPAANRWKLITVNGGSPSKMDLKLFNKEHNQHVPVPKVDDKTYKIVKDDGNNLVISYGYDPSSLTSDNNFLKDCPITLYINTKTRRLEKSEMASTRPFRIKMFKADYMNSNVDYIYNEQYHQYLPKKEEITLSLKILGNATESTTIKEYSDYSKQ